MVRTVKREPVGGNRVDSGRTQRVTRSTADAADDESTQASQQGTTDRRVLRSKYLAVKNKISDERDDLSKLDSEKFDSIFSEVENLHQLVQKPREQVADAEALLDIANTLVSSVKSHSSEGITPADFVNCLLVEFGQSGQRLASQENAQISVNWNGIGLAVSSIFRKCHGCCTMLGPMNTELKQRKVTVHRKRTRPAESAQPEEVDNTGEEEMTDTGKNVTMIFEILRRKKQVRLESLILNRKSFAQTVENLFALSFLLKDGRVEVNVNESGVHLVSPRNAPANSSVMSGEAAYKHFVFRFDFKDWKLMMDAVPVGEEMMPHRETANTEAASQAELTTNYSQGPLQTTPIRKLSRNRGLVIQEESIVEDSPEIDFARKATAIRRCKRKLN